MTQNRRRLRCLPQNPQVLGTVGDTFCDVGSV